MEIKMKNKQAYRSDTLHDSSITATLFDITKKY